MEGEKSRLIFCYGSLRPGEYNFERVNAWVKGEVLTPITSATLPGFELVDLGPYPAIVPNGDAEVIGDILSCPPGLFCRIDSMERGAGYAAQEVRVEVPSETSEVCHDPLDVLVWVPRDTDSLATCKRVKSGDWTKK